MDGYSAEIEQKMQRFFGWLSEKDRRRYAAVESGRSWGMAGSSISRGSWGAIRKPFVKASAIWRRPRLARLPLTEANTAKPT